MNHYYTSTGDRISQATLDRRIRRAKQVKKERLEGDFCEECGACGVVLDMSHDMSIQDAKNARMVELCYDVENLSLICRDCHKKKDGLNLQF